MMRSYVAAGFEPSAFWGLTPRLYLAQMRGAAERLEREHRDRAWLAWHVEALHRQKNLPDADKFIQGKAGKPVRQSPEIVQAMGMAMAAAWGAKGL